MIQVRVTSAQIAAASAMVRRLEATGRAIRPALAKIAVAPLPHFGQEGCDCQGRVGIATPDGSTPERRAACPECGRSGASSAGLCVSDFHDARPAPSGEAAELTTTDLRN